MDRPIGWVPTNIVDNFGSVARERTNLLGMDDWLTQPHCPMCDTILRDVPAGFECQSCNLLYLRTHAFAMPLTDVGAHR